MFRFFVLLVFTLLQAIVLALPRTGELRPFPCTGGSIYFSAHAVDNLLFYNPDLFHDLFVFKCVSVIVFASSDHGKIGNSSLSMENGLEEALGWMIGATTDTPIGQKTSIRIGGKGLMNFALFGIPNVQILYLRLPDGGHSGQGYRAHNMESLKKLYTGEIKSMTAVDGSATYTLDHVKETIAVILHGRRANDIRVLNHKAILPKNELDANADHSDHIISAKIVLDVVKSENITSNVTTYAGEFMRKLAPNLSGSRLEVERKAEAFFKYAQFDANMCHSLGDCKKRLKAKTSRGAVDGDSKYISKYLEREYYVM